MTREEAIAELSVIWERLSHPEDCENGCYSFRDGDYLEAIDMAIEALQREDRFLKSMDTNEPLYTEVVRCKDCTNFDHAFNYCDFLETGVEGEDFFCAYGERKGGGSE